MSAIPQCGRHEDMVRDVATVVQSTKDMCSAQNQFIAETKQVLQQIQRDVAGHIERGHPMTIKRLDDLEKSHQEQSKALEAVGRSCETACLEIARMQNEREDEKAARRGAWQIVKEKLVAPVVVGALLLIGQHVWPK